jgi:uncharacterized coiled-coil protein SlyX
VACGFGALNNNTGSGNIALGSDAGTALTTGGNNIDIGAPGVAGESGTLRIGFRQFQTFIAGISGIPVTGTPVVVDAFGQLGVAPSAQRFKDKIKPMDKASEAILALKPVTFHYKSDATTTPQFGLIAEEVAEVNPNLVVRDQNGEIYTVRYDAVHAMLLNEFLKEHKAFLEEQCKVQEQEATIAQLKSTVVKQDATIARQQQGMEAVVARLDEQATQIQKVSAQIEANKPATKLADSSQ